MPCQRHCDASEWSPIDPDTIRALPWCHQPNEDIAHRPAVLVSPVVWQLLVSILKKYVFNI